MIVDSCDPVLSSIVFVFSSVCTAKSWCCEIVMSSSIRLNCFRTCLTVRSVASKLRSRRQGVAAACRRNCIHHDEIVIEVMTKR